MRLSLKMFLAGLQITTLPKRNSTSGCAANSTRNICKHIQIMQLVIGVEEIDYLPSARLIALFIAS